MKKIFIIILLLPVLSHAQVMDTTYLLTAIPATDPHNVLVENFVGQSSANTPAGCNLLNTIKDADAPGRLNIIDLYTSGGPQTVPPAGSSHDFRDSISTLIGNSIYGGIIGLPSAGIDRTAGTLFFSTSWGSEIASRMAITDSLNLAVLSSYNTGTGVATITATIAYTQPVTTSQNISIAIVEDSIVDIQDDIAFVSGFDSAYQFNNVFRSMITSAPFGDPILPTMAIKEPGRVYQCEYTFTPSPSWVLNHCRVIAFVNGNSIITPDVYQSAQTDLTANITSGIMTTTPYLMHIYPNPAKDFFCIETDNTLTYHLLTITGSIVQEGAIKQGINYISTASISPGLYLLEISNKEGQKSINKIEKD